MLHICPTCNSPIMEGQRVRIEVSATYHALKSAVSYALDKSDLEADGKTLRHDNCQQEGAY